MTEHYNKALCTMAGHPRPVALMTYAVLIDFYERAPGINQFDTVISRLHLSICECGVASFVESPVNNYLYFEGKEPYPHPCFYREE